MKIIVTPSELMDRGVWDKYCDLKGINPYVVAEGLLDSNTEIILIETEAIKLRLICGI